MGGSSLEPPVHFEPAPTESKMMTRGNVDATLVAFVGKLVDIALLTFVILAALAQLGIRTTVFIAVLALGDSSVNFAVRPWVKTGDYGNVYFDTTERIKKRFDAEGIFIPFPRRDVPLYPT